MKKLKNAANIDEGVETTMMKDLKIGARLLLGFGVLVVLFGLIGLVSWTRMSVVKEGTVALDKQYVPEVRLTSGMERSTLEARFQFKAYSMARTDDYLQAGRTGLKELHSFLEEAEAHSERHPGLVTLREGLPELRKALDAYEACLLEAEKTIDAMNAALASCSESGKICIDEATSLLAQQNARMGQEISLGGDRMQLKSRLMKITLVNNVIDLMNATQLNTVYADRDQDSEKMTASLDLLKKAGVRLQQLENITDQSRRLELIARIRENVKLYADNVTTLSDSIDSLKSVMTRLGGAGKTLAASANGIMHDGLARTGEISHDAAATVGRTLNMIMIVIGLAVLIAMVVAVVITRMITRPLKTVVELSERAGSGDLSFGRDAFNYDGGDELGQMADAVSEMISAQRDAVRDIIAEAKNTVDSAESLAALSEETNASVEEVKSAVEQVASMSEANSAALEETNAGVQEVSTSANNSAQASTDGAAASARTIEVAEGAVGMVNGVIDDIQIVGRKSEDIVDSIESLSKAVGTISSFVDTITGIADQTNLLALNAAIEAARAGDAGRGFAVVADEVRKLAEESNRAATEVGTLITHLQNDTSRAMNATNETGNSMKKTVAEARKAQEQLTAGLAEIGKINDVMQNIAAGAQEQAAAAEQMAAGVDQVSTATAQVVEAVANIRSNSDETAKASEGVANHAQTLTQGAERMQQSLARFRVEAEGEDRNRDATELEASDNTD